MAPPKADIKADIKARRRQQRRDIHQARESLKPVEQRIENIDVSCVARPLLTQARLHGFQTIQEWLAEFCEEILHQHDSHRYFEGRKSPVLTVEVVRKFFLWLASGRQGRLPDCDRPNADLTPARLTLVTMEGYLGLLCGALRYHAIGLDLETRQQIWWWVKSELVAGGYITTETRIKPIAYSKDVTTILRCLFSPTMMASYPSPKAVWYMCLCINLVIDSCGRIGEIVKSYQDRAAREQFLTWGDVEFWVFPDPSSAGKNFFTAILTFKWLKGKRTDRSKWKKTTLRLLPVELAFEDTLRQLLILALSDGILAGITTWDQLERLRPAPTGSRIAIDPSYNAKAILLAPSSKNDPDDNTAILQPMQINYVATSLADLGRATGFTNRLTSYCFRRGIAYTLKTNTDASTRKFLMGHNARSKVFNEYESRVSTIDFQAIARGLPQAEDVFAMGGMGLGRRDDAPRTLSVDGFAHVKMDDHLQELEAAFVRASDDCRVQHGTLRAGEEACSPVYQAYHKARLARNARFRNLAGARFRQEYELWIQQARWASVPSPSPAPALPLEESRSNGAEVRACEADDTNDGEESCSEEDDDFGGRDARDDQILTGPSAMAELDETLRGLAMEEPDEDVRSFSEGPVAAPDDLRLHGLYVPRKLLRGSARLVVPRDMPFADIYDQVTTTDSLTSTQVANLLVPFVSTVHPLDRWPPHLMPIQGTDMCTSCGMSHSLPGQKYYLERVMCYASVAREYALPLWHSMTSKLPALCTWGKFGSAVNRCGHPLNELDDKGRQAHVAAHLVDKSAGAFGLPCHFAPCHGKRSVFHTLEDRIAHLETAHGYLPARSPDDLFFWCLYCEDMAWHRLHTHGRTLHIAQHLPDAIANARSYGYRGVQVGRRAVVPPCCPFCLHDVTKSADSRVFLAAVQYMDVFERHLSQHVRELDDDRLYCCPASAASGTDVVLCRLTDRMTVDQLRAHLDEVHGLDIARGDKSYTSRKRSTDKFKARKALGAVTTNRQRKPSKNKDMSDTSDLSDCPSVDSFEFEGKC